MSHSVALLAKKAALVLSCSAAACAFAASLAGCAASPADAAASATQAAASSGQQASGAATNGNAGGADKADAAGKAEAAGGAEATGGTGAASKADAAGGAESAGGTGAASKADAAGDGEAAADAGQAADPADADKAAADDADKVAPTPGGVVYEGGDTTGTLTAAPDWTMVDADGVEHKLEDYRGKIVFLNFWTTWCPYCVKEMPDIQALYEKYGRNEGDVVVLGVANPTTDQRHQNSDVTEDKVLEFFGEQGCDYPVLMDYTSDVFNDYRVYYLPTTFLIDPYGNVFGYITGGMDAEMMEHAVEQTLAGDLDKRLGK